MTVTEQLRELLTANKKVYSLILGQAGEVLEMLDQERMLVECFKSKIRIVTRVPNAASIMQTDGVYFLETLFYKDLKVRNQTF